MVAVITDRSLEQRLIEERRAAGADHHDEVWEGVYFMAPLPSNEHQEIVNGVTTVLTVAIQWSGLGQVFPGVNISDRRENWEHNYRCPDVVVFLNETQAENCSAFWFGGPDLAVEVISRDDRAREKLDFYAQVGTRELLLVDRDPWALELFRLHEGRLVQLCRSKIDNRQAFTSEAVPLTLQLVPGEGRPQIEISHRDGQQHWKV